MAVNKQLPYYSGIIALALCSRLRLLVLASAGQVLLECVELWRVVSFHLNTSAVLVARRLRG